MRLRDKFKSMFRRSRSVPATAAPSPVPTTQRPASVEFDRGLGIIPQLVRARYARVFLSSFTRTMANEYIDIALLLARLLRLLVWLRQP